jgi:hypothetical protein
MSKPYIAILKRAKICPAEAWSRGVAVYYSPGSISTYTGETLSYCFLEHTLYDNLRILSRDDAHLQDALAQKAVQALDRERHRIDANLPPNWPQGIHPEMQHWARLLFRLHYFEPQKKFVAGLLKAVRHGTQLSRKQIAVIEEIYEERGKVAGLRKRQHTQWRLRQLLAIDLEPKDERAVRRFSRWAQQPRGLREKYLPVITAIERSYRKARLAHTLDIAQRIDVAL